MLHNNDKIFIFVINGGAGKNVMATAVVNAYKKNNPDRKIIVLTAWKAIWMFNPNVYRTYQYGNISNFYIDLIKDRNKNDIDICAIEPYNSTDYILKNKHLIEIWCDLCGVNYNGEMPELFFNQREIEFTINKYNLGKAPYMVIQTNGGAQQDTKFSWMRDMPMNIANDVVNEFSKTHRIIQIRRDDQLLLPNVESFVGNLREMMVLIRYSDKRLFIDSVSQHIACALDKKSTVLWVRNSPDILGYKMHNNIITHIEDEIDVLQESVLEPYDIAGNIYQCPFKEGTVLFDAEEVIASLKN